MLRRTAVLLALTLLTTAAAPVVAEDTLHIARSVFTAEKNKQKHPQTLIQTITISEEVADPRICITYESSAKKSQGHGGADILLTRVDGSQEEIRLSNEVRDDKIRAGMRTFVSCTRSGQHADLAAGDTLEFFYEFENMQRLRRKGDTIDSFVVNGVAVANGFPLYDYEVGVVPGEEEKGKKGGWVHAANFNQQAQKNKQKHPKTLTKMLVLQQNEEAPNVCSLYRNTLNKGGKGKVKTVVEFYRGDDMLESFTFNNKIKKNTARECKVGPDLEAGDIVAYHFEFMNMPRMGKKKNSADYFEASGALSRNGEAQFLMPPGNNSPDPSDPGTGGGGPSAPGPSGGFTSADLAAVAKVLYGSRPTQLWRFKNNQPKWWTVIGPGTQLGSGLGGINPNTVGYGNSIAEAVADYERKRGKLGAASRNLSSADISALTWYANINTSQGPTSVRMGRSGGFTGEFYRPGKGAQHQTFGTFVQAIDYFKKNGL